MKKNLLFIGFIASLVFVFAKFSNAALYRTLRQGSVGADVKELQALLNKDPETRVALSGAGSVGRETTSFGSLTRQAVIKFQSKYASDVLYPAGISFPTGVVGSMTRAKLSSLYSSAPTNPGEPLPPANVPAPYINSISPSIVTGSPQMMTISGTNFSQYGNMVVVASDSEKPVGYFDSTDGKTITFPFTSSVAQKVKVQIAQYKNTPQYQSVLNSVVANLTGETISVEGGVTYARAIILVKNSNGQSNTVTVKVDIKSLLQ
jgi:peptidoglycan hydrolase-like protein with peptidoglycan-binding domain